MIKYELELEKFMENINIEDKNFSQYEDEKGNYFELNTVQLISRVDYIELSTEKIGESGASEYEQALFQKKINAIDYKKEKKEKYTPKSEITHDKKDENTLIKKEVEFVKVWNVSNPYGAFKNFNNKEEALKFAKDINKRVKSYL